MLTALLARMCAQSFLSGLCPPGAGASEGGA